ncbi:hypothetical protein [Brochothrix phage ADU4]|nr:hypothetical protein [Brochothrix phage ADU4]
MPIGKVDPESGATIYYPTPQDKTNKSLRREIREISQKVDSIILEVRQLRALVVGNTENERSTK